MNILIISSKFPYPPKDGGALAIKNMCEQLSLRVNKIKFVAIETYKHPAKERSNLKNVDFETVYVNTKIRLLNLILNFIFSSLPYIAVRFFSTDFKTLVINELKTNKYDLVILEGLYVAYLTKDIRKVFRGKIVLRAHNVEHFIWERKLLQEKNFLKKIYLTSMVKRLKKYEIERLKETDLILTITKEDAKKMKNFGIKNETYVVPFGIDLKKYKFKEINDLNLEFIGALDWMPNEEGLVWFLDNVWKEVVNKNNKIKFYVAGRNAPSHFIKKLSFMRQVIFLGEVEDAFEFISSHGIFVVPLLTGSGMRIKIVEAMALGRLVISSSIGIEGINAIPGKHFVLVDNEKDWVNTIIEISDNLQKAKEIALNGRRFIEENFSNEKIYSELFSKLKQILECN